MKRLHTFFAVAVAPLVLLAGCGDERPGSELPTEAVLVDPSSHSRATARLQGSFQFSAPVFDIAAAPDGSILVTQNTSIQEISRRGKITDVTTIPTVEGATINGLGTVGRRSFFASSGGLDLAKGAGVWRVSQGSARLIGDIESFETNNDPDALEGPQWKDIRCELDPAQGFSAGPQSNPFHLTVRSGSEALVADAAGNTLLSAKTNGDVDWVAVFTPPVDASGDYRVLFTLPDGTDCYVQPVPTSVDIGPDGAIYVGELTGAIAGGLPVGLSRVWRIEPGANNVVCPSVACQQVISGLTSVIDLAFGPDGMLYVLEYDENSWLAPFVGAIAGGTISRCDVRAGTCTVVEGGLMLPGAITFDKWGNLWVVENNIGIPGIVPELPTVRQVV